MTNRLSRPKGNRPIAELADKIGRIVPPDCFHLVPVLAPPEQGDESDTIGEVSMTINRSEPQPPEDRQCNPSQS